MLKLNSKLNIYNFCYSLFLISFIFCECSTLINIFPILKNINDVVTIVVMLLLLITFFLMSKDYYHIFIYIILSIISIVCYYKSRNIGIIVIMLFILLSQNGNFKQLVNLDFYIRLISTAIIIMLSLLNIIPNNVSSYNGRYREALGFIHPNTTGAMLLMIFLCFLARKYISNSKLGRVQCVLFFLAIILIDIVVNARSVEVCMIIALFLFLFLSEKEKANTISSKVMIIISVILIIGLPLLSIFLANNFDRTNTMYFQLNKMLSGRLDFEQQLLQFYNKPTLFGQPLTIVGTRNMFTGVAYVTDNSYITTFLGSGILGLSTLLSLLLYLMIKSIRVKNIMLWIWIVILLIWSITESQLFVVGYSLPYLLIFAKSDEIKVTTLN